MVRRTQIAQSFLIQMDSWQIENISLTIALEGRRAKPAPAGDLNNFPHRSLYLLYYKVQRIQKKMLKGRFDLLQYTFCVLQNIHRAFYLTVAAYYQNF